MNNKIIIVALVAILIIASGAYFFPQVTQTLGSGTRYTNGLSTNSTAPSAGELKTTTLTVDSTGTLTGVQTFTAQPVFNGGILQSATFSTTSTGAGTLTAANITGITSIVSSNAGALTLTLPASSTLSSFIPNTGDRVSIGIVNSGTAALTIAGGTGTSLNKASTSAAIISGGSGILDFIREADTDIEVFFNHGI